MTDEAHLLIRIRISQIEKRLAEVLYKERREAIGFALITVLCTPRQRI